MAQVPDNDNSEETHPRFQTALYVGDLDETIDETQLFNLFNDVAKVVSVRICRDYATRKSLGYAYVNHTTRDNGLVIRVLGLIRLIAFALGGIGWLSFCSCIDRLMVSVVSMSILTFIANINYHAAEQAIQELNFIPVNGKTIRVTYANRDSSVRKSGKANLYVKNLAPSVHHRALCNHFSSFGNILSCMVATDASGQSKGYGFVQFESEASAKEAIEKLNGSELNGKKIYVCPFVSKQDLNVSSDANFTNVYVKNLSNTITDAELQNIFGEYGDITSAVVMRYGDGRSKGFGFVNFANADNAARARDGLDGQTFHGKTWCVRRAQTKTERERELTELYDQNRGIFSPRQGKNLYIKNLDDSIDDNRLKEVFSEFGVITSAKVTKYANGISKGAGFVAYSNREAANRAIESMNGRLVAGKPLYVALAQKREERRAMLEEELDYHLQNLPLLERATGPPFPILMPQRHRPPGLGQPLVSHQQMIPRGNFYQGPRRPNLQNRMIPLASAVASVPPAEQRIVLGEILFPLVQRLVHNAAPKVTGMLLEMDQAEVIHMIQSADALEEKVAAAMVVLRRVEEERYNRLLVHNASLFLNEGS
ncbi:hypothetical protein V8G54_005617 [Vigna mungo]|uniref:PABP n=1 Tax=Vigna mungo TaxID=3915 RepID=A0AAQ3NZL0_VIGMU